MIQFKDITQWDPNPLPSHPNRTICLPALTHCEAGSDGFIDWVLANDWIASYQVPAEKSAEAKRLAADLYSLWEEHGDQSHEAIQKVLRKLFQIRAKKQAEFTALDQWVHGAHMLTSYVCFREIQDYIKRKLSVYKGCVLEAMCGHNSYFRHHHARKIVALDLCEESLVRYPHGNAKRFCCDLDQLAKGESLSFFDPDTFSAISVCFGYKYPKEIVSVMREFLRILQPGGSLLFFEARRHEYREFVQRTLETGRLRSELSGVGFSSVHVNLYRGYVPKPSRPEADPLVCVRAVKP